MAASDLQDTLNQTLEETDLDQANAVQHPRLLSDNGTCYFSGNPTDYLENKSMPQTCGAPYHLQSHGKIPLIAAGSDCRALERWHQTLKNRILLQKRLSAW